ncbi:MAG: alanine dehydrogenase, partial [Glutamicibacter ardleyensis]
TTFADPMFSVGKNINYYAVDHSPSYLWNSASWEISDGLLPFLDVVLAGPRAWSENKTIVRAIEIQDGMIKNPAILAFQQRDANYPHELLA